MSLKLAVRAQTAATEITHSISRSIAEFVQTVDYESLPQRLREFARFHILDVVGTSLAATKFEFAHRALSGLSAIAEAGSVSGLGMGAKLPLKDAVLMNGILAHGLDYDDTHPGGPVHPSSSAFPCVLGLSEFLGRSGKEMATACVLAQSYPVISRSDQRKQSYPGRTSANY